MKHVLFVLLLIGISFPAAGQKTVYIPNFIKNMNLNSTSSQWCHERSKQSDNVVVFWESGFGSSPAAAAGNYRVDIDKLLSMSLPVNNGPTIAKKWTHPKVCH